MHWPPLSQLVIPILIQCTSASQSANSSPQPLPNGDDSVCDCFLTNGTQPGYFSNHMFFDFRNLTKDAGIPPIVTNVTNATYVPPTSEYFSSDEWTSVWQLQGWSNSEGKGKGLSGAATVLMAYSPANVYIQKNGDDDADSQTFLALRTQREPKFQSAAAFQTKTSDYQFVSLRMLARTVGSPGAVTAMFTYRDATASSSLQESDFEVLTRGPRERVQLTNQPSFDSDGKVNPEATTNATLPGDMIWSQWAVYRLDWTADSSVWYVNGQQLANITFQVPQDGAGINFNAWSDGGTWSGNMSVYDQANLQIQWIEMIYNTSSASQRKRERDPTHGLLWSRDAGPHGELPRRRDLSLRSSSSSSDESGCKVVCSIDNVTEAGVATMLWNTSSTATRMAGADAVRDIAWAWALLVGSLVWLMVT
ncbi:glycoside hydrolase family 16 protein [Trichoderma citrinoviride]|uniref:Glycoside hydrolase family 16 protein n=1 Tax=Trichoderma citrinoviride TaxID=58853 RepID=A0A2T4BAL6_9HYPO|nr:glycoside hydrolase family 16 protein [Trichoderma citrinoviride]PTB66328.1 glycoside hydrolase family 16 protein [Trichoderma citrinoviride]